MSTLMSRVNHQRSSAWLQG